MTITVNLSTIADSIAGLSISGVTVKDIDQIVASRQATTAILSPHPDNFVTNMRIEVDELTKQKLRIYYTLNYIYLHTQIGSTLGFDNYSGLITNIAAILSAMLNNHVITGALDTDAPTVSEIGNQMDPAGNIYLGCTISLDILQFLG